MDNQRILVVEDDDDILFVVERILKRNGYTVKMLPEGDQIYSAIDEFMPHLILMDANLSKGLNGIELCKELKAKENYKHIVVIIFSANNSLEVNFQRSGADGFIAKPFDLGFFVRQINNFTNTRLLS